MVLNKNLFLNVLRKFADSPEDVTEKHGEVICQIRGELISILLSNDGDMLCCKEDGCEKVPASVWIVKRIAKLDQLANSILRNIEPDPHFIPVPSTYVPSDECDLEGEAHCDKTADAIFNQLCHHKDFRTSVTYLLSEAGDGKTMVMNCLARLAAESYRDGKSKFLFLPISLEGRPFLRIDDLVIGILANKFRFREFYYEAVIELIKMGVLVLGLDGFEEIIVEGREEAVISSLTELLKRLESRGCLVVSARKAFYDYASRKQLGLLDVLQKYDVSYPAFRLAQWQRDEFCGEMETFGFNEKEASDTYKILSKRMGADHPVLVRPVLARRFVEMLYEDNVKDVDGLELVNTMSIQTDPQAVLDKFVQVLVEREAKNKWYVTSGPEKGLPLMSLTEHYSFFETLAEEMWNIAVEVVPEDYLQEWMGIFCELRGIGPARTSDCQIKIVQHALILGNGGKYAFCHDEFRKYFFGRQIAKYIFEKKSNYQLVKILDANILDVQVVESAIYYLVEKLKGIKGAYNDILAYILNARDGFSRNTNVSQNVGVLALRFLDKIPDHSMVLLENLHIAEAATNGNVISNIKFKECQFECIQLGGNRKIRNVTFDNCTINAISLDESSKIENVVIDDMSIPMRLEIRESEIFSPEKVKAFLSARGVAKGVGVKDACAFEDEYLTVLMKIIRMFYRTRSVAKRKLRVKFGGAWSQCEAEFLPRFLKDKLLVSVKWSGSGVDDRYKLGVSLATMQAAYEICDGNYETFLAHCRANRAGVDFA